MLIHLFPANGVRVITYATGTATATQQRVEMTAVVSESCTANHISPEVSVANSASGVGKTIRPPKTAMSTTTAIAVSDKQIV